MSDKRWNLKSQVADDLRNLSYSQYILDKKVIYGLDYPESKIDLDLFHILTNLENTPDLHKCFNEIELEGIFNYIDLKSILFDKKFIEPISKIDNNNFKREIMNKSSQELSKLLNRYGIIASGKVKKLQKLALKHIPESEFLEGDFKVTDEGRKYLDEFSWIEIYDTALNKFDFNEFYRFLDENEGTKSDLAVEFSKKHLTKANSNKDFKYCDDSYIALSDSYILNEDMENALKTEIDRFIHRINPKYYSYSSEFIYFHIFSEVNIQNIKQYSKNLNINNLKELFFQRWDLTHFKKQYLNCDKAYDYLERLFNENRIELSKECEDACFDNAIENYNRGVYHFRSAEFEDAILFFKNCLLKEPDFINALYGQLLSYSNLDNLDKTMKEINKAIKIDENNQRFWSLKAICHADKYEKFKAEQYFDKAIELNPNDMIPWIDRGIYYFHFTDYEEALYSFNQAFKVSNQNPAPLFYKIRIYEQMNMVEDIEDCLENIHEIVGDSLDYLYGRGQQYIINQDFKKALECYEKCLEMDDRIPAIWAGLSVIYEFLDDGDRSLFYMHMAQLCNEEVEPGGGNLLQKEYIDYIDEI